MNANLLQTVNAGGWNSRLALSRKPKLISKPKPFWIFAMSPSQPTRRALLGALATGAIAPFLSNPGEGIVASDRTDSPLRLGIVTDPQYADKPTRGSRRYSEAAVKLEAAIAGINDARVDLLVHLGDAIDGEKNAAANLKRIFDIFSTSAAPVIHLVGNHCLDGGKPAFDRTSGLVAYHGAMRFHGWRFLLLDGNAISIRGHLPGSPAHTEATANINNGAVSWGGGLGQLQRDWFAQQLIDAKSCGEPVVVLCHFPIDGTSSPQNHLLWDHAEVAEILSNQHNVKAWFCGHNHQGGYGRVAGVHHVTFQAICDAPSDGNAWAIAELNSNQIRIAGHGTIPSRDLKF